MKRIYKFFLYLIFSLLLFFIILPLQKTYAATLTCNDDLTNKVMISEFSPASATEWVELLNSDANNSLDLSGCTLVMTPTSGSVVTKTLSGTLPRSGFLTFDLAANSMDDAGGKVEFKDAANTTIYTVSYGTYTPKAVFSVSDAPLATESAWMNPSTQPATWEIDHSTPTKGWCNPSGFSGCPSVSTITSSMSGNGVTTNLGDITDFTHANNLYFEKTGKGRITFNKEINFTDKDALSWMSSLDTELTISNGTIGMDADLIKNLVSTQATLTMYGLTLNNPTVLVNGATDTGGVVSSISYNKSTGTLTFTAAHFTTFTAVETTSSSSSSSSSAPGCGAIEPYKAPLLYQIDTTATSADLYFVPAGNPVNYHFIAFGYTSGDDRFGARYDIGDAPGAIKYTVNNLSPNTTYYFKVRGGNECMPGGWSNVLSAKTDSLSGISSIPIQTITNVTNNAVVKPQQLENTMKEIKSNEKPVINNEKSSVELNKPVQNTVNTPQKTSTNSSFFSNVINFIKGIF